MKMPRAIDYFDQVRECGCFDEPCSICGQPLGGVIEVLTSCADDSALEMIHPRCLDRHPTLSEYLV